MSRLAASSETLPLFPLTVHLMPGGTTRLRIFEPRYTRLVKEAAAGDGRFGLCMLDSEGLTSDNSHIAIIGTEVTIIDFEQLNDGFLGITIKAERLFKVQKTETESDGLRRGIVTFIESQEHDKKLEPDNVLRKRLEEVFAVYPEIASLYSPGGTSAHSAIDTQNLDMDSARWVCYRWLELLPLSVQNKQNLLDATLSEQLTYLTELFNQENEEFSATTDPVPDSSRTS